MIRKTHEWVGKDTTLRIDTHGNLCSETEEGDERIVAYAEEVSEMAAWFGQELVRFMKFQREANLG